MADYYDFTLAAIPLLLISGYLGHTITTYPTQIAALILTTLLIGHALQRLDPAT